MAFLNNKEGCSISCSRHPGEPVQRYCRDCRELLCFSCVSNGDYYKVHCHHDVISYKNYMHERERETRKLLLRLKTLQRRIECCSHQLARYKKEFDANYNESEENLESFEIVRESMKKWKNDLLEDLDGKKSEQVKIINEAISSTKRGVIANKNVAVKLPKVSVCLPMQRKMRETILELVPKLPSDLVRGSSDYSPKRRTKRFRAVNDAMPRMHDVKHSHFRHVRPYSSASSSHFSAFDEIDSSSSTDCDFTQRVQLPLTKLSSDPPTSSFRLPDDNSCSKLPAKKNDSMKQLPEYPSNTSNFSDEENLSSSLDHSHLMSLASDANTVKSDDTAKESDALQPELNECITNCKQEAETTTGAPDEAIEEKGGNEFKTVPTEVTEVIAEQGKDEQHTPFPEDEGPTAPEDDDYTEPAAVESKNQELPIVAPPPPLPPPRNPIRRSKSAVSSQVYISPNSVLLSSSQPNKECDYKSYLILEAQTEAKPLIPPPLPPPRSILPKTSICSSSTISESNLSASLLAMPKYSDTHSEAYDKLLPEGSTTKVDSTVIYDNIDSAVTIPIEVVLPEQIILASCFADTPYENVCLYDVCVSPNGYIIFSDKSNCCLRCMLGTNEGCKTITKQFKEDLQPRSLAFDNCDQRILMSTSQGLYQVKCSSHLSNMKEKRLSKDTMPLSLACSSVSVYKKKIQSLMYVTLWPFNGESCAYQLDANGEFESRISSPDISDKKPHGIDYMREYLVVTCLRDGTVAKISHRGDSLWDSSVDARCPGILKHPFGVAILPRTEYIAVTELEAHRVSIFSDEGKLIQRVGGKGTERGMFDSPRGIAVRLAKELVVVDCGNKRIQIFSLSSLNLPTFHTSSPVHIDGATATGYAVENVSYCKRPDKLFSI